jgi:hypothetical protein
MSSALLDLLLAAIIRDIYSQLLEKTRSLTMSSPNISKVLKELEAPLPLWAQI